jgi:hypothetical protein
MASGGGGGGHGKGQGAWRRRAGRRRGARSWWEGRSLARLNLLNLQRSCFHRNCRGGSSIQQPLQQALAAMVTKAATGVAKTA